MAERRSLLAGLKAPEDVDPELAKQFIHGDKAAPPKPAKSDPTAVDGPRPGRRQNGSPIDRSPLTTRIRSDFALALKRASLERQLKGETPSAILDILEEALEPWLRSHGYIP